MLIHGQKVEYEIQIKYNIVVFLDRLWRKTRSKTDVPLCYGADPNRNWDYKWCDGKVTSFHFNILNLYCVCIGGASHNPCSDTYCGRTPFSEIETLQVANFLTDHNSTLVHYINFHSYSQLWMTPWG